MTTWTITVVRPLVRHNWNIRFNRDQCLRHMTGNSKNLRSIQPSSGTSTKQAISVCCKMQNASVLQQGSSFKLSNSQMASSKTSFASTDGEISSQASRIPSVCTGRKGSYLGTRTPSEMPHLCSPPTLFVAARDRHRSAHAAKLVDVAAAQALRRHRSFHRRNSSLRWWSLLLLRRRQCLSLRPPHSSSLRCRGSRLPNARVCE
nr:hypothetical protein Iba_chr14eCG6360 [Ipomoea batatas]